MTPSSPSVALCVGGLPHSRLTKFDSVEVQTQEFLAESCVIRGIVLKDEEKIKLTGKQTRYPGSFTAGDEHSSDAELEHMPDEQ